MGKFDKRKPRPIPIPTAKLLTITVFDKKTDDKVANARVTIDNFDNDYFGLTNELGVIAFRVDESLTVRVFGMLWWADFYPFNYPNYFNELDSFFKFCANQEFYVEYTAITDA